MNNIVFALYSKFGNAKKKKIYFQKSWLDQVQYMDWLAGSEKARILTHFMHCLGKYFQSLHRPTRKYKLWQCAKVIREQIYELFNCAKIKRVKIRGTQSLM